MPDALTVIRHADRPTVTLPGGPANRVHAFRVVGDRPLVTFGVHTNGKRIVNYVSPPQSPG
jgi:hypothetical protein